MSDHTGQGCNADKIFICAGLLIRACGISLAFPHFFPLHLLLFESIGERTRRLFPADYQETIHAHIQAAKLFFFFPPLDSYVVLDHWRFIISSSRHHCPLCCRTTLPAVMATHSRMTVKRCPCSRRNIAAAFLSRWAALLHISWHRLAHPMPSRVAGLHAAPLASDGTCAQKERLNEAHAQFSTTPHRNTKCLS